VLFSRAVFKVASWAVLRIVVPVEPLSGSHPNERHGMATIIQKKTEMNDFIELISPRLDID
jgi:hypothetical protein